VGAERRGLSREAGELVTLRVTIPLAPARAGAVESLNAGVAGAVALYEFARRARAAAPATGATPPAATPPAATPPAAAPPAAAPAPAGGRPSPATDPRPAARRGRKG